MKTKVNYHELSNNETIALKVLETIWRENATKLFRDEFGKDYQGSGSIIGANVTIYRLVQKRKNSNTIWRYEVARWSGIGKTGEQEAFDAIETQIKALGFDAHYSAGRLD
jgi:hypothetical protein